jgi:hypothetical protein
LKSSALVIASEAKQSRLERRLLWGFAPCNAFLNTLLISLYDRGISIFVDEDATEDATEDDIYETLSLTIPGWGFLRVTLDR